MIIRPKYKKPKLSIIKEGQSSHFNSISQLADQIKKFILKHKSNPNSVVNSLSIGIFLGFSEAFAEDGNPETNGLKMLSKMIDKVRSLMKEYPDLVPTDNNPDFDINNKNEKETNTKNDTDTEENIDVDNEDDEYNEDIEPIEEPTEEEEEIPDVV